MSDGTQSPQDPPSGDGKKTAGLSFTGAIVGFVLGWLLFDNLALMLFAALIGAAIMGGASKAASG